MRPSLPALLLSVVACGPSIHIETTYPEPQALPKEVRTLAVIDRVEQGDSAIAVEGLRDALRGSTSLMVVRPGAVRRVLADAEVPAGQPLDRAQSERLCAATGATGIVSLERFQLQGDWFAPPTFETVTVEGPARVLTETGWVTAPCGGAPGSCRHEERVMIARYDAAVETSWLVRSCLGQPIVARDLRTASALEGRGERSADARDDAGDPQDLEAAVARAAGATFAALLAPSPEQARVGAADGVGVDGFGSASRRVGSASDNDI